MGTSAIALTLRDIKLKDYANGIYVAAGSYYVTITVAGDPTTVAIDSVTTIALLTFSNCAASTKNTIKNANT